MPESSPYRMAATLRDMLMHEIGGPYLRARHIATATLRARAVGCMRAHRRFPAMLVVLAGISGCSPYEPPFQGDHASQHYQSDLASCRTSSRNAVRLKNAAAPGTWIISPITGPPEVRAALRQCMQDKGYVLAKTGG